MLYVFGDSFSSPHEQLTQITRNSNQSDYPYQSLEMNWCGIVSEQLNGSTTHINDAILGCPNEYIYQSLLRRFDEMQAGDQAIVQLSSYDRQWFIESKPHLSNFESTIGAATEVPKQTQKAIDMFYKNLYFEERYKIIYQAFVSAMFSAGIMLDSKGVKLLIIPGFHDISGIVGTLSDASSNEFENEETMGLFYTKTLDSRYNHLTERNHKILADKVIKYFTADEMVDLTTGFESSIYNKDNI